MRPLRSFLDGFRKHWIEGVLLFGVFAALLATTLVFALRPSGKADRAEVMKGNETVLVLPLSQDGEWEVKTDHGTVKIAIKERKIAVISSPCPSQYCVHMGFRDKVGDTIVCAHCGVSVSLYGDAIRSEVSL